MAKINGTTAEYYVGVMHDDTMSFVYEKINETKMSYWMTLADMRKEKKEPLKMTRFCAENLMWALRVNGYRAYVLTTLKDSTL